MKNEEYFEKQCEVIEYLCSRGDKDHSAIKFVIRCAVRQACNFATDLPGYDSKKGAGLVSKKAHTQILDGDFSGLIGEHVVPISVILRKLDALSSSSAKEIGVLIRRFCTRAVITKAEDSKLGKSGLKKKMPQGWDGGNEMARYDKVEIETLEISYQELLRKYNKSRVR